MKTRLYSFDSLKPQFLYRKNWGLQGCILILLFLLKNSVCGYTLENHLAEAVLTSTHNLRFEQKYENCQNVSSKSFHSLAVKFSIHLNRHVFMMAMMRLFFLSLFPFYGFLD